VGVGYDILDAYLKAYKADPVSIYGGIIAANRPIDERTAIEIGKIFVEIIIAPDFTEEALALLTQKKNIRLMKLDSILAKAPEDTIDIKKVSGGLLVQDFDNSLYEDSELKVVTDRIPTDREMEDMRFAMKWSSISNPTVSCWQRRAEPSESDPVRPIGSGLLKTRCVRLRKARRGRCLHRMPSSPLTTTSSRQQRQGSLR
jgi:AICAR transformylase/IMP cyclohydrolase PurH